MMIVWHFSEQVFQEVPGSCCRSGYSGFIITFSVSEEVLEVYPAESYLEYKLSFPENKSSAGYHWKRNDSVSVFHGSSRRTPCGRTPLTESGLAAFPHPALYETNRSHLSIIYTDMSDDRSVFIMNFLNLCSNCFVIHIQRCIK